MVNLSRQSATTPQSVCQNIKSEANRLSRLVEGVDERERGVDSYNIGLVNAQYFLLPCILSTPSMPSCWGACVFGVPTIYHIHFESMACEAVTVSPKAVSFLSSLYVHMSFG